MSGRSNRFAAISLAFVLVGCGSSTPPTPTAAPGQSPGQTPGETTPTTPSAGEQTPALLEDGGPPLAGPILVTPTAVLLTGAGQTAQLQAQATFADGSAAAVTWTSSDPAQVSVDAHGTVTAVSDLGSALVFADAGDRSTSVAVLIAQPAAGAFLLTDAQVLSEPQPLGDPQAMPSIGDRYRVTLAAMDPAPSAGTVLLPTGSARVAGRVVTVTPANNALDVEYEGLPLPQLLARYQIDLDVPIDLPDTLVDVTEPTTTGSVTAAVARPGDELAEARFAAEHKAEKEAGFKKGPLKCKATAAAKFQIEPFDIKATTNLVLQVEGRKEEPNASTPEHTKVVLTGPVALAVSGGVRAQAGFDGSVECEVKADIPIPIGGVLAAVLAVTVPIGLSATLDGSVKAVDVDLGPAGHLGTTVTVGFQCDTAACWAIKEHTPDKSNGVNFNTKVNWLPDLRVEASLALNVLTGLGFKVGTENYSLIDAKVGPVQSLSLAFDSAQARDTGYASNYDLKIAGSVTPGSDLRGAIAWMTGGLVSLDLSAKYASDPFAESPKGTLNAEKARVEVDKPVKLWVDLDSKTINYSIFGPNVAEVRIARWKDDQLHPLQTIQTSSSGQTRYEWTWTPTEDFVGMNELVAYVVTNLVPPPAAGLPPVPLEIAPQSSAYVEVVDACIADPPTPAPSPAPGATPAPPQPSAPPEDPCAADLTITFERDFDELLIDERWVIAGDLERLEDAELLPDQPEGDYVGVGQYSGGANQVGCPTEAHPAELTPGQGRMWLTGYIEEDGGLYDGALAGQRILVVQVMPVIDDVIANPGNSTPGALIAYVPIEGGTHTTIERWTDGFLTCGVLGETRKTVTLQPGAVPR